MTPDDDLPAPRRDHLPPGKPTVPVPTPDAPTGVTDTTSLPYAAPQYTAPQHTTPPYTAPDYTTPQHTTPQHTTPTQPHAPTTSATTPGSPLFSETPPTTTWTPPTDPAVAGSGTRRSVGLGILAGLAVVVAALLGGLGVAAAMKDDPTPSTTVPSPTIPLPDPVTTVPDPDPEPVTTTVPEPTTIPTTIPVPIPTTVPTTVPTGPFGNPDALRGEIVVMIWSDFAEADIDAQARSHLSEYSSRVGVPLTAVHGDWYRSLRDGTIGVVYLGGFGSVQEAARWCVNQGLSGPEGLSCFGVELSDRFTTEDKGPNLGRMYPAGL